MVLVVDQCLVLKAPQHLGARLRRQPRFKPRRWLTKAWHWRLFIEMGRGLTRKAGPVVEVKA